MQVRMADRLFIEQA